MAAMGMHGAVLLTIATGILWGLGGSVLSRATRIRLNFPLFMGLYNLLAAVAAWAVFVRWERWSSARSTIVPLALLLSVGALALVLSRLSMARAMIDGPHGSVWTINQTSCVVPFLFSLLFWGEEPSAARLLGVGAIVAAIATMGAARNPDSRGGRAPVAWFVWALLSLGTAGVQQIMMSIPSRWPAWSDVARIRPALFFSAQAGLYLAISSRTIVGGTSAQSHNPFRVLVAHSAVLAAIALSSNALFFVALDALARHQRLGVGYPLAIGMSILSFAVYSWVVLGEPLERRRVWGVLMGVVGVVLLSF